MVTSGISWYIYDTRVDAGGKIIKPLLFQILFYFVEYLTAKEIYLDCTGQIGGTKILDECGICSGNGPQFSCESSGKSYCTEYIYQQECKSE